MPLLQNALAVGTHPSCQRGTLTQGNCMGEDQGAERAPRGLDRVEVLLFAFGVIAFALLMLIFGQPLVGELYLPVVAGWIISGLTFIWWFDRHLAHRAATGADERKVTRIDSSRRRRRR
jgi:hypothetical protein